MVPVKAEVHGEGTILIDAAMTMRWMGAASLADPVNIGARLDSRG